MLFDSINEWHVSSRESDDETQNRTVMYRNNSEIRDGEKKMLNGGNLVCSFMLLMLKSNIFMSSYSNNCM